MSLLPLSEASTTNARNDPDTLYLEPNLERPRSLIDPGGGGASGRVGAPCERPQRTAGVLRHVYDLGS